MLKDSIHNQDVTVMDIKAIAFIKQKLYEMRRDKENCTIKGDFNMSLSI